MKLELSPEWYKKHAAMEDDYDVTAGVPFREFPAAEKSGEHAKTNGHATEITFGKLLSMLRRERMLSVEQLAAKAGLPIPELLMLENEPNCLPSPQTATQLARVLGLSGCVFAPLTKPPAEYDLKLQEAATRFTAQAPAVVALTPEERSSLEEFMGFLQSQTAE